MSKLSLFNNISIIAAGEMLDADSYKPLKERLEKLVSEIDGSDDWCRMTRARLNYISSLLKMLLVCDKTGGLIDPVWVRDRLVDQLFLVGCDDSLTNYINK